MTVCQKELKRQVTSGQQELKDSTVSQQEIMKYIVIIQKKLEAVQEELQADFGKDMELVKDVLGEKLPAIENKVIP